MKKITLLLILLSSFLFSQDIKLSKKNKEEKTDSKETLLSKKSSLTYSKAMHFYKQKNYKKAYEMFNRVFKKEMGNKRINFYLGRSAYEIKNYEMALSAYERVLIVEPHNARVKLEIAQTYLKMKLYTQAQKEFNEILVLKIPNKVKEKVKAHIIVLKKIEKKHFFNQSLIFNIIHDSNINNSADAGDYSIYLPEYGSSVDLSNSGDEQSVKSLQSVAVFSHLYKKSDNLILTSNTNFFNQKYSHFKEKDVHAISINTTPTYLNKKYKLSNTFNYDRIWLGHKSYLNSFSVIPKYSIILNDTALIETGVKIVRNLYIASENKERNSNSFEWKNSIKKLTKQHGIFTLALSFLKEIEDMDDRTDVSKSVYSLLLAHKYTLPKEYLLNSAVSYKDILYKDKDVNFLSRREDKKTNFSFNLSKPYNKNITYTLGSSYTINNSNHSPYEYNKYNLKLGIVYGF